MTDMPSPSNPVRARAAFWIGAAAASALAMGAGVFVLVYGAGQGKVVGRISTAGSAGSASLLPNACWSGQQLGFSGLDAFAQGDPSRRLRLLNDPVGGQKIVVRLDASRPGLTLDRAECSTFDVRFEQSGSTYNDVYLVGATIKLHCEGAAFGTVDADVSASNCSYGDVSPL